MGSNLIRWAGLAGVLAGPLWIWGMAGLNSEIPPYSHAGGHLILAAAGLTMIAALLGLRALGGGRSGPLGTVGVLAATTGAALLFVGNAAEGLLEGRSAYAEYGWGLFMLGIVVLGVGAPLIGVAALRTAVLPRSSALALLVGPAALVLIAVGSTVAVELLGLLPRQDEPPISIVAVMLACGAVPWLLLGRALWSSGRQSEMAWRA